MVAENLRVRRRCRQKIGGRDVIRYRQTARTGIRWHCRRIAIARAQRTLASIAAGMSRGVRHAQHLARDKHDYQQRAE